MHQLQTLQVQGTDSANGSELAVLCSTQLSNDASCGWLVVPRGSPSSQCKVLQVRLVAAPTAAAAAVAAAADVAQHKAWALTGEMLCSSRCCSRLLRTSSPSIMKSKGRTGSAGARCNCKNTVQQMGGA